MVIIATWFAIGPQSGANAFQALVLGLILYNGAVFAEIFRAGINAVPKGQSEAAYAIGMGKSMVMRIILIPQAVKIMLPALISQAIVALKDTSLGYAVLAPGLTYAGKQIFGTFRNTIQTAFVMALIYIVLNLLLTRLATWAQKRFVGEKQVDLVGGIVQSQPDAGASGTGAAAARSELQPLGVTQRWIVPSTVTVPSVVTALTLTGTSGAPAQSASVRLGRARQRCRRLGEVADLHALGQPAHVVGARRLGEQPHGRLETVAGSDGVDRADVVLDRSSLGDADLRPGAASSPAPRGGSTRSTAPSG